MADDNAICVQCFARGAESAILRILHAVCFSGDVAWQVQSGARYPSGLRERSAKPPFVGSNPPRASKYSILKHSSKDPLSLSEKFSETRQFFHSARKITE